MRAGAGQAGAGGPCGRERHGTRSAGGGNSEEIDARWSTLPWDLDVGFMIHMSDGAFLYSSMNSERSFGRRKVVGIMLKSGALPAPAAESACLSSHVRSSSLRYRLMFLTCAQEQKRPAAWNALGARWIYLSLLLWG